MAPIAVHHHFGIVLTATDIGIGIAAISAAASAASAFASARGVSLSHKPFVVGTGGTESIFADQGTGVVEVQLRNHGPGVALNVRFRGRAASHSAETYWSPPVAMLRPGEQTTESLPFDVPPDVLEYELKKTSEDEEAERQAEYPHTIFWTFETQFSDIRGVTWRVRPTAGLLPTSKAIRTRSLGVDFWRPKPAND